MAAHRHADVRREGQGARLLPEVARHPAEDPRGRRPARRRASRPTGSRSDAPTAFDPDRANPHRRRARAFLKPVPPKTPAEALEDVRDGRRLPHGAGRGRAAGPQPGRRGVRRGRQPLRRRDDATIPTSPGPARTPLGAVRLLRDTDGDGRFDQSARLRRRPALGRPGSRPGRGASSSPRRRTSGTSRTPTATTGRRPPQGLHRVRHRRTSRRCSTT